MKKNRDSLPKTFAKSHVILLRAPRNVMEELLAHGWHPGNWRDVITGQDNGLRKIVHALETKQTERKAFLASLRGWADFLAGEAVNLTGGVPVAWHPSIKADDLREAMPERTVVEISANTLAEALEKWGQVTGEAREAPSRPERPPIALKGPAVFWHIACLNHWKDVVGEQLRLLSHVGLCSVSACVLGSDEDAAWCRGEAQRHGVSLEICVDPDLGLYERPTLQAAWDFARANLDHAILYFHTKGVSCGPGHAEFEQKTQWRRAMQHQLFGQWRRNLETLKAADVSGLCWVDGERPHFTGNFWMARADWLANLPSPDEFRQRHQADLKIGGHDWTRMWCEMWLGSKPSCEVDAFRKNLTLWTGPEVFELPVAIDGFSY